MKGLESQPAASEECVKDPHVSQPGKERIWTPVWLQKEDLGPMNGSYGEIDLGSKLRGHSNNQI